MLLLLDTQILLWWLVVDLLVHGDPFDRLLIAQARLEGLMAVSSEGQWRQYEVLLHHA